ncbi:thioester domain-containing protein [Lederbergia lenta]|uniref:thioester domain-containing protein n=1 Tax=Lederbergia lenta TaxID=1467 RepID=UPI002040B900|nr:thioester domain-containing protein [Lederbergia lenta]MCM3113660.1 hypothetical protein [Lederbergia lenta]
MLCKKVYKFSFFILSLFAISLAFFTNGINAEANFGDAKGPYSWTDPGGNVHTTAYITINGQIAFCMDPHISAPYGGVTYKSDPKRYDKSYEAILYYGYGGDGNELGTSMTAYIKTYVALNNWEKGKRTQSTHSNRDPQVWKLIQHAQKQDAPNFDVSFNKTKASTSVSGNVQKSETIKLIGNGSTKLNVPSQVTIHVSGGKTQKGGSITINGGQSFHFTAPLNYGTDYKTGNVNGSVSNLAALLYLPTGNYQRLLNGKLVIDPVTKAGFTVDFEVRQKKITINHKDKYNNALLKTQNSNKNIGTKYSYSPDSSIKKGNNTYVPVNRNTQTGTLGNNDITLTFFYNLQRTITVKHVDAYDNKELKKESYNKLRGDKYSYAPNSKITIGNNTYVPVSTAKKTGTVAGNNITVTFYYDLQRKIDIKHVDARDDKVLKTESFTKSRGEKYSYGPITDLKKGNYTYRPVSNSKKTGTVGSSDITLTFYYDVPLIKAALEKIQVYTAPADKELPVKVHLSKENIYPTDNKDMTKAKLNISLYQGKTKVDSNTYTAKALPKSIDFKVDSSHLVINQKEPYTVKIESFSKDEVDVVSGAAEITTDGYTSSERSLNVNDISLSFSGVIMTEREVGKNMVVFNENLQINLKKVEKKLTGYGFEYPIDVVYTNDLGQKLTSKFDFHVPKALIDTYLSYPVSNNLSKISFDETNHKENINQTILTTTKRFELPEVNIEKRTGYLFSNSQVDGNDNRIKYEVIDGGRKFYTPIWGDLGTYQLDMKNVDPLGVHKINVSMKQNLEIHAYMYGHMDSSTGKQDAIYLRPINADDPNYPENWTAEDKRRFKEWNQN